MKVLPDVLTPAALQVTPNPELRGVVAHGANVLPTRVVQDAFRWAHHVIVTFASCACYSHSGIINVIIGDV